MKIPFLILFLVPLVCLNAEGQIPTHPSHLARPPPSTAPEVDANVAARPRPLERWMNRLQQTDPDEYARLQRLQTEDPESFRDALRERVHELRRARGSVRDDVEDSTRRRNERPRRSGPDAPTRPTRDPFHRPIVAMEQELAALAEQHRRVPEAEQPGIRQEMRQTLDRWLDLKHQQTEHRIRQAEIQLERLRHMLKTGHEQRDEILEHRLKDWLRRAHEPK